MKNKQIKNTNYQSDDLKEIKTLIIITLVIVAIALGLYYLTEAVLAKKKSESEITEAVISYTEATIGTMFTRPYDEYYVFAYSSENDKAKQYNALLSNYTNKENSKKIYFIDLASNFNSKVLSETSNKKPTNALEVKIKDSALIMIKNGKVTNYYETLEEFEKALN